MALRDQSSPCNSHHATVHALRERVLLCVAMQVMLAVPIAFHIVRAAMGYSIADAIKAGWVLASEVCCATNAPYVCLQLLLLHLPFCNCSEWLLLNVDVLTKRFGDQDICTR